MVRAMVKSAGKTTTNEETVKKAKRLFFSSLLDISWRLAIALAGPIVGGAWLDDKRESGQVFTLIGLLFGTILAGFIIFKAYKKLNKDMNEL